MVRRELGPSAEIVESREVVAGILGRIAGVARCFEVTACRAGALREPSRGLSDGPQLGPARIGSGELDGIAADDAASPSSTPNRSLVKSPAKPAGSREELGKELFGDLADEKSTPPATPCEGADEIDYREAMRQSLTSDGESLLADLVQQQMESTAASAERELQQLVDGLVQWDLDRSTAAEIVQAIRQSGEARELIDPRFRWQQFVRLFRERTRIYGPIQLTEGETRRVAFMGPTGTGKTTTIAKLAANFRLHHRLQVGLISFDSYRVGAVEQMRAYADMLDIPCDIVTTAKEMRGALGKLADMEIVLIDTAGRNPHDAAQMDELNSLLFEARVDEVHLVLSAQTACRHMQDAIACFQPMKATSMVWTKLDEVQQATHLLPLMWHSPLPLSYTTHGQRVPDDIQVMHLARFLEWLAPQGLPHAPHVAGSGNERPGQRELAPGTGAKQLSRQRSEVVEIIDSRRVRAVAPRGAKPPRDGSVVSATPERNADNR